MLAGLERIEAWARDAAARYRAAPAGPDQASTSDVPDPAALLEVDVLCGGLIDDLIERVELGRRVAALADAELIEQHGGWRHLTAEEVAGDEAVELLRRFAR